MHRKIILQIGARFDRLTVVDQKSERDGKGTFRNLALCRCECGTEKWISVKLLCNGQTKSCGCLKVDSVKARSTKHRGVNDPEYDIWGAMIQRCTNPKNKDWRHYGGRGVKVCERWRDYRNFIADVGKRPAPNLSIDRIENNGDYEPGNVRWATRSEQSKNSRPTWQNRHRDSLGRFT